ncbi:MAG: hypothetical protein ACRDY2_01255 [Acidimicrobiales bacterium]
MGPCGCDRMVALHLPLLFIFGEALVNAGPAWLLGFVPSLVVLAVPVLLRLATSSDWFAEVRSQARPKS